MKKTFYYLAVNGANNKKMTGEIMANGIEEAHRELNRLGFSVLLINNDPIVNEINNSNKNQIFEFEATDKTQKKIHGTIEAENRFGAYNRLLDEFNFDITYLCEKNVSDAIKQQARRAGVTELIKLRQEQQITIASQNGIVGNLSRLFKKDNPLVDQLTISKVVDTKPKMTISKSLKNQQESMIEAFSQNINQKQQIDQPLSVCNQDVNQQIETISSQTPSKENRSLSFLVSLKKIKIFGFDLVDFSKNQTYADIKTKIQKYLAQKYINHKTTNNLNDLLKSIHNMRIKEYFWSLTTILIRTLAIVFSLSFFLVIIMVRYDWGATSMLAEKLIHTTLLPFLAFSFLLFYLANLIRKYFKTNQNIRTSLLFTLTTCCTLFVAINFLY